MLTFSGRAYVVVTRPQRIRVNEFGSIHERRTHG